MILFTFITFNLSYSNDLEDFLRTLDKKKKKKEKNLYRKQMILIIIISKRLSRF